jgi:hypothetical protein
MGLMKLGFFFIAQFEKKFRGLPANTAGLVFFIMATWVCDTVMVSGFRVYMLVIFLTKAAIRYGDS